MQFGVGCCQPSRNMSEFESLQSLATSFSPHHPRSRKHSSTRSLSSDVGREATR